ncbi:helix-turn-helix transcriptional regulator [Planobispora longispora]|uniref:HTH araC/xylS-type domain-containing protein n=1 Tax=Planobispora longispora TaxID=28887 RepID=A0A8J3RSR8_9ACTN|nr:AraC family transcriptional regulator [Planobispora longispora]GIH80534.1 hypothetical protein Plo01_69630 [Planobispora longispora]
MDEGYSSAAMSALVAASLRRRGLSVPAGTVPDGPRVPLAAKRRLLAAVVDAYGEGELLQVGWAVAESPFDALGHVLVSASTPHECLARWRRLERYVHSRHRTAVTGTGPREARLHHTARTGPGPTRHENLLVASVLAGLLLAQGCGAVRLSLPGGITLLGLDRPGGPGGPADGVPPGPVDRFHLTWVPGTGPPATDPELAEPAGNGRGPVTRAVLARVLTDPTRRWTVGDLSAATGMSGRTLQRRLRGEGGSFSAAVATARVTRAAVLLASTDLPLSTIGFLAGYADGPHFAREFARRTGTSPGRYRTVATRTETDHDLPL